MQRRKSIKYSIIILILFITIVPSIFFLYISIQNNSSSIDLYEEKISDSVLSFTESSIKNEIIKIKSVSSIIRNSSELAHAIIDANNHSYVSIYVSEIIQNLDFDFFQISDTKKIVLYRYHDPDSFGDYQHFLGIDNALQGESVLIVNDELFGWSIKSIMPIEHDGEIIGTVTLGTLLDDDFATNISDFLGGDIDVVFSLPDETIASSGSYENNDIIDMNLLKQSFNEKRSIKFLRDDGIIVNYQIIRIIDHTIGLIIIIDMSDAIALFSQNLYYTILFSIFITLISLILALYIISKIINPLKTLTSEVGSTTKKITGKNIEILSGNEIVELNNAFHTMVTEIEHKNTDLTKKSIELSKINNSLISSQKRLKSLNENLSEIVKQRTKEIETLLKQKDEFIYQLGHDLKNPLGPLLNLLPIIEKQEKNEKISEMLHVVNRNVAYMKNLVTKTIQLAQLKSPNVKMNYESFDLGNEVQSIIEANKLMFDDHNITVINNIPKSILINADKLKIQEVFNNLFNNSVKYSHEDKGLITLSSNQKVDSITISLKDDGIGMNKEQLDNVFTEFYKADSSRHDFHSSGLGMSICKRIVEMHGGKIWVESDGVGKGSMFFFTLPLHHQDQNENIENKNDEYHTIKKEIDSLFSKN